VDLLNAVLLDRPVRAAMGEVIKGLGDIEDFPELEWFNSAPCPEHAPELNRFCMKCGIKLRKHQKVGAGRLYMGLPMLLSDTVGSGKTAQVIAFLAMCRQNGELNLGNRAVIVCKAAAVRNVWAAQLRRLAPGLNVLVSDGEPADRLAGYMGDWEVAVVSSKTFAPAKGAKTSRDGDVAVLEHMPVGILVTDDLDELRNHTTQGSYAVNRLARRCTRVIILHATPMQKRVVELWCQLQPVGGREALGTLGKVRALYVSRGPKMIVTDDPNDPTGREKIRKQVVVDTGLTDDPVLVRQFQEAVGPLVLRRTADDLDDVELPDVEVNPVWIDLSPRQRQRYEDLRKGVLRVLRGGQEITFTEAKAAYTRGWQICSGLAALDEGEGTDVSAKLDWVVDALTGDLSAEKAVVFVYFKKNVAALSERLRAEGIGHVLMWGAETNSQLRDRRLELFRTDPRYRVLVGTTTIEASLNLQSARHLIAVDTILNPARMEQLVGRIRRDGSAWKTVFFHHLLSPRTQEVGILPLLRREQQMSDIIWGEQSDLFRALSPRQMMQMVAYGLPQAA
jgi:SNF2 family DNA or RNA helicase